MSVETNDTVPKGYAPIAALKAEQGNTARARDDADALRAANEELRNRIAEMRHGMTLAEFVGGMAAAKEKGGASK